MTFPGSGHSDHFERVRRFELGGRTWESVSEAEFS